MKKYVLIVIFALMSQLVCKSQPFFAIPTYTGVSTGIDIAIPVWGHNWSDISTFSTVVYYDDAVLTYLGHTQNPILGSFFVANATSGAFSVAWFSLTPISFTVDTLFYINFHYNGGCTYLNFDTTATPSSQVQNGSINCNNGIAQNIDDAAGFKIFPNPATSNLTISGFNNARKIDNIRIMNILNETVMEIPVGSQSMDFQVPTIALPPGTYVVALISKKTIVFTTKFFKM
jgi:hypothetical protein